MAQPEGAWKLTPAPTPRPKNRLADPELYPFLKKINDGSNNLFSWAQGSLCSIT